MTGKQTEAPQTQGQPYDNILKLLIEGQETQVLPQILPGVEYLETLNIEVLRTPLRVDRVYRVLYRGQKHTLHLEFETASDKKMSYRLLDYHAYFLRKYEMPVLSIIIYPFPTTVVESPLIEESGRETILTFHFRTLCLWMLKAEEYVQKRIIGMYALLPTMQGANEYLLKRAIDELVEEYRNDQRLAQELLWLSILLERATLIKPEEKERVQEKISMWNELFEQDPRIRQMKAMSRLEGQEEGMKKGMEKGMEKGIERGREESLSDMQDTIMTKLNECFPALAQTARADIERIRRIDLLLQLFAEISVAQNEAAARRAIAAYLP